MIHKDFFIQSKNLEDSNVQNFKKFKFQNNNVFILLQDDCCKSILKMIEVDIKATLVGDSKSGKTSISFVFIKNDLILDFSQ
jgi:hypothetical protein